jgi:hypothetical protein
VVGDLLLPLADERAPGEGTWGAGGGPSWAEAWWRPTKPKAKLKQQKISKFSKIIVITNIIGPFPLN